MKRKTPVIFYGFMIAFILKPCPDFCQEKNWTFDGHFNIGCQVFLYGFNKSQGFPGLRAYAAFGARCLKGDFMINYGPSVSVYTRTIGANLNPLVGDWQIDFTNSFTAGILWGGTPDFTKYTRTLHNGDYYNLAINRYNAVLLSTNFTLNNHGRHQTTGAINLNFHNATIHYYNDGGPPFDWIPLGDKFDRYWTGGGCLMIHSKNGYNLVEFGFDQFTGYRALLYEVSNILGLKVPLYDKPVSAGQKNNKPPNHNTGTYFLKAQFGDYFSVDAGVTGSLVDKKGKFWGVQDNIHIMIKNALHPNNDGNRFYLGGSFNKNQDVSF